MSIPRRTIFQASVAAGLGSSFLSTSAQARDSDDAWDYGYGGPMPGMVFISTNAAAGNEVLVFSDFGQGGLRLRQRIATSGTGTGGGLGSQGAVTLSGSGRYLFVVNAGSNSVSTFRLTSKGLRLMSVMPSGGLAPTSVTEDDGLVFVLNTAGDGNVSGFVNLRGRLLPIANSTRGLSAAGGTAPAQVGLTADGGTLVVAERATNRLTTYTVMDDGSLSMPQANASVGMTPFGFAFDRRGHLLVSEAFGGAANASAITSYRFQDGAPRTPVTISPSVGTQQTAACWVAITPNGRYAYTTNTASGSISLYRIEADGRISLAQSVAAMTAGSGPIDASVSMRGRSLYVLRAGTKALAAYRIASDGSLMGTGAVDVPMGSAGMAAT